MLRPAARGKLFFAGEAMSACNGYVISSPTSSMLLTQILPTDGSQALWIAHGVLWINTSPLITRRAVFKRSFGDYGAKLSTGMKLLMMRW